MAALLAMLKYSPAPQMKYAEPDVARAYLISAIAEQRVWFMGGYMLMVDVGSDWYGRRKYLIEQIILKVYRDDDSVKLETVIGNGLAYLADFYSCVATVVGDTQVGYMTPKYLAAGFQTLGTQLIKENRRGSSPQDYGIAGSN